MAKANWLNVAPASGSGNGTVNFSSVENHTGRSARTTTATFKASGVAEIPVSINQAGKPEYVTIAETVTASKAGGPVTISGKSNSSKLSFTLGTGTLVVTLPAKYTANSAQTDNNVAIVGDPGAAAEYDFSLQLTVPANASVTELTKQIIVTDAGGHTDTCQLKQAVGDAKLTVAPTTIELTWQGAAVSAAVTSNTSWSVV